MRSLLCERKYPELSGKQGYLEMYIFNGAPFSKYQGAFHSYIYKNMSPEVFFFLHNLAHFCFSAFFLAAV